MIVYFDKEVFKYFFCATLAEGDDYPLKGQRTQYVNFFFASFGGMPPNNPIL